MYNSYEVIMNKEVAVESYSSVSITTECEGTNTHSILWFCAGHKDLLYLSSLTFLLIFLLENKFTFQ